LKEKNGNFTVSQYKSPRLWNLVYADSYACELERPSFPGESPNYIGYTLQLLNPDRLGNPTEHFEDDETGTKHSFEIF